MAALGILQLVLSLGAGRWQHPGLLLLYMGIALVSSVLQLRAAGSDGPPLSANVPVVLLSILQLGMSEAVLVGAAGALGQGLRNKQTRAKPLQLMLAVCMAASAFAIADFVYRSLIPNSIQSPSVRLFAASLALFFANTFPVSLASHAEHQPTLGQYWKESSSWLIPYYLISAALASAANAAAVSGLSVEAALMLLPAIYLAYRYYRMQKLNLEIREKTAERMAALHLRTIEGLALAVEAKDNISACGHLRRVRVYALGLGQDLGLAADELEALQAAALLHDIGKLAVPEYILSKPGKLTAEEFAKMKVHPIVGAEIIEQVQFPYPVAPIIRAHHEKWDGSGYPFGLKDTEIPVGARILSAVDFLDALASDRDYRRAIPLDDAMKMVQAEAGKAFDPAVVRALTGRYQDLERVARDTESAGVKLSKNVAVERGHRPDAGLDLWALAGLPPGGGDPLNTIAEAGREQQMLLSLTQGMALSLELETILERTDQGLRTLIPYDAMSIFVPQGNSLLAVYSAGDHKAALSTEVRAGEGLIGWVALHKQPIVNGNPAVEREFGGRRKSELSSALAVPLRRSNGLPGVLAYYRTGRDAFNSNDLRILTSVASRIGIAIENALKVRELQEHANRDVITGLPTMAAFVQALDVELIRAQRQSNSVAVLLVRFSGLDALREQGSAKGADRMLESAAKVLTDGCREYDTVARMGSDTLGVIFPGMKIEALAAKIEALQAQILSELPSQTFSGPPLFQFGWAIYPDDAATSKLLLAIAERRSEMQTGGVAENLLALHSQYRQELDPADTEVSRKPREKTRS